mmetsp:Transcript_48717/g.93204  ORF Transcript_48717/g.93204 Transcript_48717/m.93204 type:complete len:1065 (-) Transcript_48717:631-3825(-)
MDIGWELLIELGLLGKSCTLKTNYTPCEEGFTCVPCMMRQGCKSFEGECYPCVSGDLCPAGSVNEYAWTKKHACPPGMICPNRTAAEPCKEGWFCPLGSFTYLDVLECNVSGTYCPEGSEVPTNACPKGFYCPTPKQKFSCPKGHYCKAFSVEPFKCDFGTLCPAGSEAPGVSVLGLVMLLLVMLSALGLLKYGERKIVEQQLKKQKETNRLVAMKNNKKTILSSLLGVETSTLAEEVPGFDRCARPITIQFLELGLTVGSKALLQNVSGAFKYGKLVAVMGPSGCGKSTLLNTLCGKATYGKRVGRVLFNTKQREITAYRQVIGFVPQDDTVFPQLTVEENLFWSANLRLPVEMSTDPARLSAIIEGAIQLLNLDRIQSSVVGDVKRRGISGGQKKRVNIGVEMCSDPTVLFMDEPTSGLAATDTLTIIRGLHSFAHAKRTIIAVIHQPRYLAFILFHDVMLLYPGGFTVFFGQATKVQEYFNCLGFAVPKGENPADFFLDVISDRVPKNVRPGEKKFKAFDLCTLWTGTVEPEFRGDVPTFIDAARAKSMTSAGQVKREQSKKKISSNPKEAYKNPLLQLAHRKIEQGYFQLDDDKTGTVSIQEMRDYMVNVLQVDPEVAADVTKSLDENGDGDVSKKEYFKLFRDELKALDEEGEDEKDATEEEEDFKPRMTVNVFRQFFILLKRTLVQKIRLYDAFMMNLSMMMVCGLLVGILLGSDFQPYQPQDTKLTLMMALIMAILVTLSAVNSLQLFGYERVMIAREKSSGVSIVAFFLAKCIIDVLENFWQPLFFLGFSYNFILPMTDFMTFYTSLIFVSFAASGVGILFGVIIQQATMTLATVLFSLVLGIFLNGTIGLLYANVKSTGGVMLGLWTMSFSRWAQELLVVGELEASKKFAYQDYLVQTSVLYYGYFPPFETKNKWEDGKTSEEKSKDWEDYFDSYGNTCRMNLVLIGLGLRLIALICLRFWEEITSFYGKVSRWISGTMKKVYGFSKDMVGDVLEEVGIIEEKEERQRRQSVERASLGSAGSTKTGPSAASNKVQPVLDEVKVMTPSDHAGRESR